MGFFVAGNLVADHSSVIFGCNIRLRSLINPFSKLFPLQNVCVPQQAQAQAQVQLITLTMAAFQTGDFDAVHGCLFGRR